MRITTTTNGDIAIIIPRKDFDQLFTQKDLFESPKIDLKGIHSKTISFLKDVYKVRQSAPWTISDKDIIELRKRHGVFDVNNSVKTSIDRGIVSRVTGKAKHIQYIINYEFK